MSNILQDAQEEALYNLLGKTLNQYIEKNPLPPVRLIRILINLQLQIVNKVEQR